MAVSGPKVVVRFLGDATHLNGAVAASSAGLGRLGAAAAVAGAAGVAAIGGFAAFSISAFADFDQAMTQSTAIMGDLTDEQLANLEKAARDMGKTTTFSATEAAESIFFLASAGLDAEQSIAALPAVAAFAQAGMFDMATATDLVTDAQSALGLTVDDSAANLENMTRVSDVLVGANTLANASVEQFSAALTNKAGPAMRALGVDLEEGVAVLAALADQGIKGEEAGTQFSMMLRNMTTQAAKLPDVFDEIGVNVFDAEGNLNSISDIIGDLEGVMAGLTAEERKNVLAQLGFGDKAQATIFALLGTSDAIAEYSETLTDMGGITEEVADKQLESFKSQINLLKSRFTDFAITVGSKLAPLILQAIGWLEEKWKVWGPTVEDVMRRIWDAIVMVVSKIQDFVQKFRSESGDAETTAGKLRQAFEDTKIKVEEVFAKIQEVISTAVEIVTVIWEKWGDDIVAFLIETWNAVMRILEGAWTFIQGIFELIAGILTGDWGRIWEGAKMIVSGAFDFILGLWDMFFARLRLFATVIWDIITNLFDGPLNWITETAGNVFDEVVGFITGLPGRFLDLHVLIFDAAKSLGGKVIDGIVEGVTGVVDVGLDLAKAFGNALIDFVNDNIIDRFNSAVEIQVPLPFGRKFDIDPPDIPDIPSFAKGAFVTAPTMAVVGDAPGEGEFVAPESKLKEAVIAALREGGGGGGVNIGTINMHTDAKPEDLSRELGWAVLTGGI